MDRKGNWENNESLSLSTMNIVEQMCRSGGTNEFCVIDRLTDDPIHPFVQKIEQRAPQRSKESHMVAERGLCKML